MTIQEILEAHRVIQVPTPKNFLGCACGMDFFSEIRSDEEFHRAHVAEVLEKHMQEQSAIPDTPLNPDALVAATKAICGGDYYGVPDDEMDYAVAHLAITAYLAVAQPVVNSANFPNVTRVEIIRDGGRALTQYGTEDVFYDVQDEGRTLKVFMKVPSPDYSAYRKVPYPERERPEVNDA